MKNNVAINIEKKAQILGKEIWMKYNTKITPIIIIDKKVFKGVPSILELLDAILSRNIKHPDSSVLVQLN